MALPDPVTVAASAPTPELVLRTIPRTLPKGNGIVRVDATGEYEVTVTHDRDPKKAGERHVVRIQHTKDATNPYTGGLARQTAYASLVFAFPPFGWDATQKAALVKALTDFVNDSEVTVPKLLQDQA